jgi:hypothetical protein
MLSALGGSCRYSWSASIRTAARKDTGPGSAETPGRQLRGLTAGHAQTTAWDLLDRERSALRPDLPKVITLRIAPG